MDEESIARLIGIMMDRMGIESFTITKQDLEQFEGGIESEINTITDSCTITRFK